MSWNTMREKGGGKTAKLTKKICKAKELLEDLCDEFEEMEDYFGERYEDDDDEMRERYRERRGRY